MLTLINTEDTKFASLLKNKFGANALTFADDDKRA